MSWRIWNELVKFSFEKMYNHGKINKQRVTWKCKIFTETSLKIIHSCDIIKVGQGSIEVKAMVFN